MLKPTWMFTYFNVVYGLWIAWERESRPINVHSDNFFFTKRDSSNTRVNMFFKKINLLGFHAVVLVILYIYIYIYIRWTFRHKSGIIRYTKNKKYKLQSLKVKSWINFWMPIKCKFAYYIYIYIYLSFISYILTIPLSYSSTNDMPLYFLLIWTTSIQILFILWKPNVIKNYLF